MGAVRAKILVVDDEPQVCSAICHRLTAHGFNCQTSSDPQFAKEVLAAGQFDVLIADIAMPVVSGLDLLVHAKRYAPDCKVILITGKSDEEVLAQALMFGAYEYPAERMLDELSRYSGTPFDPQIAAAAPTGCDTHPKGLIRSGQPVQSETLASIAGQERWQRN